MTIQWSRKETAKLISLLETKREIWDVHHPSYSARKKKESSLREILNNLRNHVPNTKVSTIHDIRRKIQSLRSQYRKEVKKMQTCRSTGVGKHLEKKPSLWFYHQLEFLKPFVEIRESRSSKGRLKTLSNSGASSDESIDFMAEDVNLSPDELKLTQEEENRTQEEVNLTQEEVSFTQKAVHLKHEEVNLEATCSSTKSVNKGATKRKATDLVSQSVQNVVQLDCTNSTKSRRFEWLGTQIVETLNEFKNENTIDDTVEALQTVLREGKKKDKDLTNTNAACTNFLSQAMRQILEEYFKN